MHVASQLHYVQKQKMSLESAEIAERCSVGSLVQSARVVVYNKKIIYLAPIHLCVHALRRCEAHMGDCVQGWCEYNGPIRYRVLKTLLTKLLL